MNPDRPDRDTWLIKAAQLAAERSTCGRAHVGAVIAREGRIVVTGYNGAPSGLPHCDHTCNCLARIRSWAGHNLGCPAEARCETATHAEANAIAWAARHGISTENTTLYCTTCPCLECARLIINAGIVGVKYLSAYRLANGLELLERAGVEVIQCLPS